MEKLSSAEEWCERCGGTVGVHVARGEGQRGEALCWRCYNTKVAAEDGYPGFAHVDFAPVPVKDYAGRVHTFEIRTRLAPPILVLEALETKPRRAMEGYRFAVVDDPEADLFVVLGRLLERVRRGLAVQHVERAGRGWSMTGPVVRGRVTSRVVRGEGQLAVVVDGVALSWEELGAMVQSYEGWQFRLEMLDLDEEA